MDPTQQQQGKDDWEKRRVDKEDVDIRSRLSPRHSRSSMFLVMILVTSFRFSFS
jgi:hypothetical protein